MKHLILAPLIAFGFALSSVSHADLTGPNSDANTSHPIPHGTGANSPTSEKWREYFYTHPKILSAAIQVKVGEECQAYITPGERLKCWGASAKLVNILDIAPSFIHSQRVNVTFAHKLVAMMQNPAIQKILTDFLDEAGDVRSMHDDVNNMANSPGWNQFIAVLFQDSLQSHINYLRQVLPADQKPLAELLWNADQKFYQLLSSPVECAEVYPTRPGSDSLYHFFVIKYLQQALVEQGVPSHIASVTAFLFNYVYKIQEYQSVLQTAFKEPAKITSRIILADLYLGYQGAFQVSGKAMPEVDFTSQFQTNVPLSLLNICSKQ